MRPQQAPIAGSRLSRMRLPALLVASLALLMSVPVVLFSCGTGMGNMGMGDMGSMHAQMHGGGPKAAQTPVDSSATEVTVEIRNYDFFPRDLTVQRGARVTWIDRDNAPHDATDVDRAWGTGTLTPDKNATLTFDDPGVYDYVCTIHPNMEAKLTVL